MKKITRFLYVTTQLAALMWVSISYGVAIYSTVALGQVFPAEELSSKAIDSILAVGILKTVENLFEHNDGGIFGTSHEKGGGEDELQPGDHSGGVG